MTYWIDVLNYTEVGTFLKQYMYIGQMLLWTKKVFVGVKQYVNNLSYFYLTFICLNSKGWPADELLFSTHFFCLFMMLFKHIIFTALHS